MSFYPAIHDYNYYSHYQVCSEIWFVYHLFVRMENLQKENELLKEYVTSLEKENSARNIERNTLFHEIDRMTAQIDRLSGLLSRSNSRVIVSSTTTSDKEIADLKRVNTTLIKEIDTFKASNSQLTSDLRSKGNEILMLNQQQQRLTSQIKTLRDSQSQWSSANNKILILENEINNYKLRANQVTVLEQNIKTSNARATELESLNRKFESDYRRAEENIKRQQNEVKRLESQNRQLKLNNKSAMEMSTLLSSKLNLEATVRQLNGKIEWLQGNRQNAQQERQSLEKRIRDLEKELLQTKGKLTQFRYNEQSLKSFEASLSIKDKEMEALEQMIGSLKENKKYLEKVLREKQEIVIQLESQNVNLKNHTTEKQSYQRQISELQENKSQLQHQINILAKNNQDHVAEVGKLLQREQNYISEINSLCAERERLLRDLEIQGGSLDELQREIKLIKGKYSEYTITQHQPYFRPQPERDIRSEDEADLRFVVSGLKSQIEVLKASQFMPQVAQNNSHSESCVHLNLKSQLSRQNRSPQREPHLKLLVSNQRDKSPFNKRKWDTLQRKINALRSENETLKRSLFD